MGKALPTIQPDENLSIEIGMDCINNASMSLNVSPHAGNLLVITKTALQMHPESQPDIILASLLLHDSVTCSNLRAFIAEIGQAL